MSMTDSERRKFFRIEVDAPIRFRLIEEKTSKPLTDWMNGSTVDVGLGGIKVITPMSKVEEEILVDKYLFIEISFELPGVPEVINATAAIVHFQHGATNSDASTITFGVSFVSIDSSAKDALGEFIRQRLESLG